MVCNVNCLSTYSCSSPAAPESEAILAPFVEIVFGGGSQKLTVGNQSSPPNNRACISSFEYGLHNSGGFGFKAEIIDEGSTMSKQLFEALNKSMVTTLEDTKKCYCRFGWIKKNCNGQVSLVTNESIGGKRLYFLPLKLTSQISNGIVKHMLEAGDQVVRYSEQRQTTNFGDESNKMPLKQALRSLFTERDPKLSKVEFRNKDGTGEFNFKGSDGGANGPKAVWTSDQQSSLATARKWLGSLTTEDNRGILIVLDNTGPGIIFQEDPSEKKCCGKNNLGTYVVNGGNCLYHNTVLLTDIGWKRISDIVKNQYEGKIACLNNENQIVWSEVQRWIRSPRGNRKLFKVHLENSRQRHNSISGGIFTEDHKFLTQRGYVELINLTKNDKINSGTFQPNEQIRQAIIGSLLGDSYISKASNKMGIGHCIAQKEYALHKAELFGLKSIRIRPTKIIVDGKASPFWRNLRRTFYPNGKKIIPPQLMKEFGLISLAYLYMDDGSLTRKNKNGGATIATCSFTKEELLILIKRIKELGIKSYLRNNKCENKYPRILFDKENAEKLSYAIAPYVHENLNYKLLPQHRDIPKISLNKNIESFFDEFKVFRCEKNEKNCKTVYCIEVKEFPNFITHSGVVHNCSPVISFSPELSWILTTNPGGGAATPGASSGGNDKFIDPEDKEKIQKTGSQTSVTIQQNEWMWRSPSEHAEKNAKAEVAHTIATNRYEVHGGVQAELKIQGNPKFDSPEQMIGKNVSVIVINPFYLQNKDNCQWLTTSACNTILSNKNWQIIAVSHQINSGSYTTTLKLSLAVPNSNIDSTDPLGGCGGTETVNAPATDPKS